MGLFCEGLFLINACVTPPVRDHRIAMDPAIHANRKIRG